MKKTYYYKSFEDDVVQSKEQEYKLKENYKWIKENIIYKLCSCIVYFIFFIIRIFIYKARITCKN